MAFGVAAGAVVIAAGGSTRMGRPKALLRVPGGAGQVERSFVARIVETARAGGVVECVVVLGPPHGELVERELPGGVARAWNAAPERGMLSSIQVGVGALASPVDGTLVWPVDLPLVRGETVRRIVQLGARDAIVVPVTQGRGGHPVWIGREFFDELGLIAAGLGLRELMRAHAERVRRIEVDDAGVRQDVDTPEDYARILGLAVR